MKEEYELIPYNDDDYELVYNFKKNAYKKYVEECWGKWNEKEQQIYFKNFIDAVRNDAYIIVVDGNKIGFYNGINLNNDCYEIGNILIIPEYQKRGIGTKILNDIIEKHKGQDLKIKYFKQNPVGILYERLGFEHTGETNTHYLMSMKSKNIL